MDFFLVLKKQVDKNMKPNLLILHIKIFRNNYYFILSNILGKVLFKKNSGILGFKNANKKSIEALKLIFFIVFKYIFKLSGTNKLFLKLEGSKKNILREIYKQFLKLLNKFKIKILGLIIINKISFNGCRKKK